MIRIRAELLLKCINFASLLKITLSEEDHRLYNPQLETKRLLEGRKRDFVIETG